MKFSETPLKDAYVIEVIPFSDERGLFFRTFCKEEFKKIGHDKEFIQFNHSINYKSGTLRGMHYQMPPYTEIKLVRCIHGKAFDVIVDIRHNSPTFLKWFSIEISAENKLMIYIPPGFAHGFQTMVDDTQLIYHHTANYNPAYERGLRHNDPLINIKWQLPPGSVSEKDLFYPLLTHDFKGI